MSGIVHGLVGAAYNALGRGTLATVPSSRILNVSALRENPQALYAMMRALAANTGAYKSISDILPDYGLSTTAMQGLRNPTHAVCSFYEANGWSGTIREDDDESALPLITPETAKDEKLRAAIHMIWRASNWNDNKDGAFYDAAMLGDQVLKVRSTGDQRDDLSRIPEALRRSWFELVSPDYMTDLDVDGRGYLTYIRLDVPQLRRDREGKTETYVRTDIWDKENQRFRRWEHKQTAATGTDQLGTPIKDEDMEQVFGTDFVPFVHWQFDRESGSQRGVPAVMRALDKILYGDAITTSLHRRLSRENDWLLKGTGTDPDGIPLPPPPMTETGGTVAVGDGYMHRLPAGWDITSLVAGLDFAAHLAVVKDHYLALQETDLPELAWGAISEAGGDVSGRALNYKLTPAKSRLEKARGRAESSLIRATQMCLSVAQKIGAPGFSEAEIGRYDRGELDFWIADRPIVPLSEGERSEIETQRVTRVKTWTDSGAGLDEAARVEGYTDEQVDALTDVTAGIER